ncbi:holin [Emergencia timonensis]|uniref:holin n=1 Tax=Emergencia timonensis TaxID=1776384 RepID=UPI0039F5FF20
MTREWFKCAAVRAVKTMAQSALGALGTTAMIQGVDWTIVAGTAALAGVASILTSITGLPECKEVEIDA